MSRVRLKWWFSTWLAVAAGLVVALSWAPVRQLDALPVILVNVAVALAVFVHFRLGRTDGLTPLLAIGVSLAIAVSIVILVSREPLGALEALLLGPLTRSTRWSTWITDSITLALLGFAFVIVFRARQISLGADGQLHAGALFGALAAFGVGLPGSVHWLVVLVAAALGGFLLGGLAGALKSRLGANEVVSTLMLNVIALRVYEAVLSGPLLDRTAGYIQSERFPHGSLLPNLVSHTTITVGLVFVLLAAIALTVYLGSTTSGYRARIVGANAAFARYGGIDERRVVWLSMALSGAIAGLAGAHLVFGVHERLILNVSIGLGYEGIVVALMARNRPWAVPFCALLYGYLRTGGQILERESDVSYDFVRAVLAVVLLLITAEWFRRSRVLRRGATTDAPVDGEIRAGNA